MPGREDSARGVEGGKIEPRAESSTYRAVPRRSPIPPPTYPDISSFVKNHSFGLCTLILLGSTIRLSVRSGRHLIPLRGTAARLFRFSIACVLVLFDGISHVQGRRIVLWST